MRIHEIARFMMRSDMRVRLGLLEPWRKRGGVDQYQYGGNENRLFLCVCVCVCVCVCETEKLIE